ncbi:hypothetical protein F5Y09DRAFT_210418 [Xylaria sp. FL1042]|nr:hypothetical protein F5Y09DRAFT_210418 [Xylaria sp. FL1042]
MVYIRVLQGYICTYTRLVAKIPNCRFRCHDLGLGKAHPGRILENKCLQIQGKINETFAPARLLSVVSVITTAVIVVVVIGGYAKLHEWLLRQQTRYHTSPPAGTHRLENENQTIIKDGGVFLGPHALAYLDRGTACLPYACKRLRACMLHR